MSAMGPSAFQLARSHVRFRPKSVIGRLLSHSRKQTFAVLLHRQDCAHCRRLAKAALPSKADAALARAQGSFGWESRHSRRSKLWPLMTQTEHEVRWNPIIMPIHFQLASGPTSLLALSPLGPTKVALHRVNPYIQTIWRTLVA